MKKVLMMAALVLGTSVMVNAQEPAKTAAPAKEVKAKHHKKALKKAAKMEAKADAAKK